MWMSSSLPPLLDRYPFDALPDTDLFVMRDVARAMLLHHKVLLDRKSGRNRLFTDEALSCEPYYLLATLLCVPALQAKHG